MPADPLLGEIVLFAGNFAPRGWAFCEGQLLAISQNSALFSILGTTYGGDGEVTFALPDLRGRSPLHPGNGPGLSSINLGQGGGSETGTPVVGTTLTAGEEPHSHEFEGGTTGGGVSSTSVATVGIADSATSTGQTLDNRSPYRAINFIIALQGVFPSRS